MSITKIQDIDGEKRQLTLSNNAIIELRFFDSTVEIFSISSDEEQIGSFQFNEIEIENGYEYDFYYKLTHAFIEGQHGKFKRHGIGTEVIKFAQQCSGCNIELPINDGLKHSDGSHMTDEGVAFVEYLKKLQRENKINGLFWKNES